MKKKNQETEQVSIKYYREMKQALEEIKRAENCFDTAADPDLAEWAALGISAAKKKYAYILKQAKNQGNPISYQ